MAPPSVRARSSTYGSTTSSRPRPISRASTTSVNTPTAPNVQPHFHTSESAHMPSSQHFHPQPSRYASENLVTQSQQRPTHPREYAIDPSLENQASGGRAMSVDHAYSRSHDDIRPAIGGEYTLETRESQFPVNFNDEQTQDDTGPGGESRKKKGSASSIANDQELRKLFRENGHRDLKDVASDVLAHERGPKSEKTKQIFAMNW